MNRKRFLLVLTIVIFTLGATSCKLPASTPPPGTATLEGCFPVPGSGTDTMGIFETIATQTALAALGTGQVPVAATPTSAAAAATKTPKPTSAPVEVAEATPGIPTSYTLQKGEFPYCIARRFNLNPNELLVQNGLNANSTTYPGMKLSIPQTGHSFPGSPALHSHPATYTVKSGDTIYTVACYYGNVDPLVIAKVNGLSSPYTLKSGQELQIP